MTQSYDLCEVLLDRASNKLVVILGNSVEEGNIWCADWDTFETVYPLVKDLQRQTILSQPSWEVVLKKAETHAEVAGDSNAMWWCAWYYENTNHPKSVWYYMAAMRRAPKRHGWALNRVRADAYSAYMAKGIPPPDLTFLSEIEEFHGSSNWGDWKQALEKAKQAIHLPITKTKNENSKTV